MAHWWWWCMLSVLISSTIVKLEFSIDYQLEMRWRFLVHWSRNVPRVEIEKLNENSIRLLWNMKTDNIESKRLLSSFCSRRMLFVMWNITRILMFNSTTWAGRETTWNHHNSFTAYTYSRFNVNGCCLNYFTFLIHNIVFQPQFVKIKAFSFEL